MVEEKKEAIESELEKIAEHFIKKVKENSLDVEPEYDLQFVDFLFHFFKKIFPILIF